MHGRFVALLALVSWGATPLSPSVQPTGDTEDDVPWADILAPRGEPDLSLEEIVWRDDLAAAFEESAATGRPLFITLRCLPCKQCAGFDTAVLEGGPRLAPLLRQFITVRLTDAFDIEFAALPAATHQDLDVSWWGYFLSPGRSLYGVFGGRDAIPDARISPEALAQTLERILAHHHDPRRPSWNIDRPATTASTTPRDLPGLASWQEKTPEVERSSCLHCHQLAEVLRQPALDGGRFDPVQDLALWPVPEQVGLSLERDHGLRVSAVEPESPADRAGLQVGDLLGAADGTRLFSQTDVRGVLHRAPWTGTLPLVWLRDGDVRKGVLALGDGWKTSDLTWRMSVSQGNIGGRLHWFPNRGPRAGKGSMSIRPWFGPHPTGPSFDAGLRGHHELIGVDGERPDLTGRAFQVWFRLRYQPGDTVTFEVRGRDGVETIEVHVGD